jgi:hypothetical protein
VLRQLSYLCITRGAPLPALILCLQVAGARGGNPALRHNKRMHATADTGAVM